MKRLLLIGVLLLAVTASNRSMAAGPQAWVDGWPGAWASAGHCDPYVDYDCALPHVSPEALRAMERSGNCDPYLDYKCLDAYLGDDVVTRFGETHLAPAAMFWRAVAQYSGTHDHAVLGAVAMELRRRYPASLWTSKAIPWLPQQPTGASTGAT